MAGFEPRDRGAARGDGPVERYVRQLLRDADRMRRSTQPRTRSDGAVHVDRSLLKPPLRPSHGPAPDGLPPTAG